MMAITHMALAGVMCVALKAPEQVIALAIVGSVLPDIDQPRSMVGKALFVVSYPINKLFGHRKFIHSVLLWGVLAIVGGLYFKPLMWLGLGAVSHCLLDCWNTKGVELCAPITEKMFVLGSRKYRIISGTRAEFIVLGIILLFLWLTIIVEHQGGLRGIFERFMGRYEVVLARHEEAGKKVCYVTGKLRLKDGTLKQGRWLVIGTEGSGLALYDSAANMVVHVPEDGKFSKVNLEETATSWESMELRGVFAVESDNKLTFVKPDQRWVQVERGDLVFGTLVHLGGVRLGEGI